ncbi:RNA polymerase sigma factor [Sphingobium sufflavum]|uniref:RNA polymerase sigma factor n=1 Tax=Sphingobium sufflavum TaxID=1129547 RepID=UPI001F343A60|nr:RNA polymerase sigma factor [Sphingobium sufflavum]MCE7796431.1 RNA polymerase sigma factor [Sphingobium sufflavum]
MTVKAFSLMAQHRVGLLSWVQRRVRPPIEPADIVQETWARAMPAIEAGRVENVQAYLYGIARNLSAEAMRQQSRWSRWLVQDADTAKVADDGPTAEAHVMGRDELARLHAAMELLPLRCREIFAMRHVEMLEKSDIAARLDISIKQVERQLRLALVSCARTLGKDS